MDKGGQWKWALANTEDTWAEIGMTGEAVQLQMLSVLKCRHISAIVGGCMETTCLFSTFPWQPLRQLTAEGLAYFSDLLVCHEVLPQQEDIEQEVPDLTIFSKSM